MFSIFRNSACRNTVLESLSFGVLFFAKELVSYLKGRHLRLQVQELLTLIFAVVLVGSFYCLSMAIRAWVSKEKAKAWMERVYCILICLCGGILVSYGIREGLFFFSCWKPSLAWSLLFAYFLGSTLGILFFRNVFFKICQKVLLFLSPLGITLILFVAYTSWEQTNINQKFSVKSANLPPQKELILFLIFDEWDPCVLFSKENENLFPASYRWRRQSFYADRAYPAGTDTAASILSMTLGKQVDHIWSEKGKLHATFKDIPGNICWEEAPNVLFRELFEKGVQIGCVGGMITDYGKTFAPYVSQRSFARPHSLCKDFLEHFLRAFSAWIPEVERGYCPVTVRMHRFSYENDVACLQDLIRKKQCSFIFAHLLGGHFPALEGCTRGEDGKRCFHYLSNLKVIDRLLDEIEQLLKKENLWDSTTCILTSDHWWRVHMWKEAKLPLNKEEIKQYAAQIDHRIPLFIKLRNLSEGVEYQKETSTLFMKELFHALVDGVIDSPEGLKSFFSRKEMTCSSEIAKWENLKY